jgi:hypothetical protein
MDNPADSLVDGKGDFTAATGQVNFLLYLGLDIRKSKDKTKNSQTYMIKKEKKIKKAENFS